MIEALDPTKIKRAIRHLAVRVSVELITLQTIACIVIAKISGPRCVARESFVSAHPQVSGLIIQHAIDHIVGQALLGGDVLGFSGSGIELVQPATIGADPQQS